MPPANGRSMTLFPVIHFNLPTLMDFPKNY